MADWFRSALGPSFPMLHTRLRGGPEKAVAASSYTLTPTVPPSPPRRWEKPPLSLGASCHLNGAFPIVTQNVPWAFRDARSGAPVAGSPRTLELPHSPSQLGCIFGASWPAGGSMTLTQKAGTRRGDMTFRRCSSSDVGVPIKNRAKHGL